MSQNTASQNTASQNTAAPCHDTSRATPRWTRLRPAVDLVEQSGDYVLHVEMPGVSPEAVSVSVERNIVTVHGEVESRVPEGFRQVSGDPGNRRYERSFQLSDDVDRTAIDAEMKHGVLTLKFPKAQQARKASIPVKAG